MKHKQNQGFSTFDFLTMTASVAIIFFVSTPIIKKNLEVGNIDKAQRDARTLAFELLHNDKYQNLRLASAVAPASSRSRGIASVSATDSVWTGEAGKDPWGNPYRFRFLRNDKGMPVEIVVWSHGPEKKHLSDVKVIQTNGMERLQLDPDDVVAQVPLR